MTTNSKAVLRKSSQSMHFVATLEPHPPPSLHRASAPLRRRSVYLRTTGCGPSVSVPDRAAPGHAEPGRAATGRAEPGGAATGRAEWVGGACRGITILAQPRADGRAALHTTTTTTTIAAARHLRRCRRRRSLLPPTTPWRSSLRRLVRRKLARQPLVQSAGWRAAGGRRMVGRGRSGRLVSPAATRNRHQEVFHTQPQHGCSCSLRGWLGICTPAYSA